MAGDWIKMRADLFTHPKVVRIASALKADTLKTVGGLMSVWCLFDAHSEDGFLDGYTPDVLDAHLRWPGFAQSMVDVGWLIESAAGGLSLPRFDTHNGQSAKRRAQDADRKREGRKVSAPEADKKRTREEKRREEISITNVIERDSTKAPKPAKRATQIPAEFYPNETGVSYAEQRRVSMAVELQSFRNFHQAKGSTFKDWQAAWRTWCDKAVEFGRTGSTAKQTTESFYERDQRLKAQTVASFAPGIAAKAPAGFDFIEGGVKDVTAIESH